jgi:hypothetical protein
MTISQTQLSEIRMQYTVIGQANSIAHHKGNPILLVCWRYVTQHEGAHAFSLFRLSSLQFIYQYAVRNSRLHYVRLLEYSKLWTTWDVEGNGHDLILCTLGFCLSNWRKIRKAL